jgi:hypothetical protein
MARVTFRESDAQIVKQIQTALAKEINARIKKALPTVKQRISPLLTLALSSSPEISSLKNGILRLEFGLENDPSSQLVSAIMQSLNVRPAFAQAKRGGGIIIELQPSGYGNLLAQDWAQQEIEGGSLPWLKWLLTAGDSIIIADFGVEFGTFPESRTGGAKMTTNLAPYKVNSAFSGTPTDNFITRAISKVRPEIEAILRRAI